MSRLSANLLLPLNLPIAVRAKCCCYLLATAPLKTRRNQRNALKLWAQSDDSSQSTVPQQQVNLSVLRFTFGIPWLDESQLPRWIGYGFGSLILLNHFIGSNSPVTSAQLVSEALGLSLAAFSVTLPFVGKFLKGATTEELTTLPEHAQQIFVMSQNISDNLKEDLAWTSYVLLRNTKSLSVLIYLQDVLCVRGYWKLPEDLLKHEISNWFTGQITKFGLFDVRDTLYFPQSTGSMMEEAIPYGTGSILIQPVLGKGNENIAGFVLLASSISYAYGDKDRLWIQAIANKFRGERRNTDSELP